MLEAESDPLFVLTRQREVEESCRRLVQEFGPIAFQQLKRVAIGLEPTELAKKAILKSSIAIFLRVRDGRLEVLPDYRPAITRLHLSQKGVWEHRDALCLPSPDSKPPRPF